VADSKRPAPAASAVGRRTFSTAFRGYDQEEVKAYLEALAYEFRDLRDRITELEGELAAERGKAAPEAAPLKLDIATLTTALGEETARVLRTAQEAADDVRTRAEEGAARTLREAHEEAARVRTSAEGVLAERTAEAEQEVARIRREAQEETARLRREATATAEAEVAKAVEQGRDMLSQAQAARERVLSDLARRRKVALNQIDQLRAGRERLHAKLHGARVDLERMMDDMARSDEEARLAEEAAGHVPAKATAPAEEGDRVETVDAEAVAEAETVEEPPGEPAPEVSADEDAEEVGAVDAGAAAPASDDTGEAVPTAEAAEEAAHADAAPDAAEREDAVVVEEVVVLAATDAPPTEQGDDARDGAGATEPSSPHPTREAYRHDPVPAGLLPGEAVGEAQDTTSGRVDELFARMRADRAGKVEAAHAVLSEPEQEPAPDAAVPDLEAPRTDEDEDVLQRRDEALDQPTATTVRAVRRGLGDDQNAALEQLRKARAGQLSVDTLLGEEPAHVARAVGWATPGLTAASKAAVDLAGGADVALPADAVAPIAERLAAGLMGPVRQRVAELLDDAGDDHGPDTADRINGVYREARGRIDLLVGDAVTEVVSGAFSARLPAGTPVRWVVEDVDGPCPDCDDNALAGPTPLGQAFPTGQTAPPAHPGCRCVLAPMQA
jgi:DivIVA domain-containing protein